MLFSTSRQPVPVKTVPPCEVGRLPTTTQPPFSISSAVVSPMPPGHGEGRRRGLMRANWVLVPCGETWTIVVPVPCMFLELLKLLTRTSPWTRLPWLCWTTAVPYGLTSPLAGTVDAIMVVLLNFPMNDLEVVADAGAMASPAVSTPAAAVATAARVIRFVPRIPCSLLAR